MTRAKIHKTNAMRELERAKIPFELHTYDPDDGQPDALGVHVAEQLGEDPACVFKTLVTVSPAGTHVTCCIPVARELDLKAAARAAQEKSLSMLPLRDLLPKTGYVRGGCSPIGMKKKFKTIIDESCLAQGTMMVSGGARGVQIELAPADLVSFCSAVCAPICHE